MFTRTRSKRDTTAAMHVSRALVNEVVPRACHIAKRLAGILCRQSSTKMITALDIGRAARTIDVMSHDSERLLLNCPKCGQPLRFISDPRPDVHVYWCTRDGAFHFTRDGAGLLSGTTVDGDDEAGNRWAEGVAREWVADLTDPRQDIYSDQDGQPVDSACDKNSN